MNVALFIVKHWLVKVLEMHWTNTLIGRLLLPHFLLYPLQNPL